MRAGQLDKQITVEYPTTTSGEYGEQPGPWAPLIPLGSPPVGGRLWANVQDVLPQDAEQVVRVIELGRQISKVRIRYRSDITSAMRITVHGATDVIYTLVAGPAEIGRKEWTEFYVERFSS